MKNLKKQFTYMAIIFCLAAVPYQSFASEDEDTDTTRGDELVEDKPWYEEVWDWIWE